MRVDSVKRVSIPPELYEKSILAQKDDLTDILVAFDPEKNAFLILPNTEDNWENYLVMYKRSIDSKRRFSISIDLLPISEEELKRMFFCLEKGIIEMRMWVCK